ncbi:MAG: phosphoribosyltransferase family protein [Homoserinimonas sp.]
MHSTIRRTVVDAALDAWAVLMPVDCAGCGTPDRALCLACRSRLTPAPAWHRLPDGTPTASALDYADVTRQVILAFKEQGRTDVAGPLAAALRLAIDTAASGAAVDRPELALVPTTRQSYRRRGYDPVALLVRRAGFARATVLRRSRGTLQQKALDVESRSRNLVGSLRAVRPLHGRSFILIDDVMTTGATLTEAARALREAGGVVLAAATAAHTARLFPTPTSSS